MKMNHYTEIVTKTLTDGSKVYDVILKGTRIAVTDENAAWNLSHALDKVLNDSRVVDVAVKE